MNRLARDGTAKRGSRDQILRPERGFRLTVEIEHADAGRDGQTCLVRPNSQVRTGIQTECGD